MQRTKSNLKFIKKPNNDQAISKTIKRIYDQCYDQFSTLFFNTP